MVTQQIIIQCNHDLTQCFNRILCHVAQINNQSYFHPLNMATIIGKFIEGEIYAIKTANGITEQKYSHSENSTVFGMG